MKEDLVKVVGNIAVVTKKVDDALNAKKISTEAMEKASEENKPLKNDASRLQDEANKLSKEPMSNWAGLGRGEEKIAKLESNMEIFAKEKLDAEETYTNLLAEKRSL
ncbi:hypothetical protein Fot_37482 [Forsythia ovata]|uniref:Uncharacterized protein n=1 Tax=Forsythia ovata TaxID=205694 RepID=A0ABD1RZ55_9LAMI